MRKRTRLALAVVVLPWLTGCHYQIALPVRQAAPTAPAGNGHVKLGVTSPTPDAKFQMSGMSHDPYHATVDAMPEIESALIGSLSSKQLDAFRIVDPKQPGADLVLALSYQPPTPGSYSGDRPATLVVVSAFDPVSGVELRRWVQPGPPDYYDFHKNVFIDKWMPRRTIRAEVERSVARAIEGFSAAIAGDGPLLAFPANEPKARVLFSQAQDSEKAGKAQDAFDDYRQAVPLAWPGGAIDVQSRAALIRLVRTLPQPPVVPDEARRHMDRGKILVGNAHGVEDYKAAAAEMNAAVLAAPWWADGYFNLGLVQANEGAYADAIANLKAYLAANPASADAGAVEKKIDELELKAEGKIAP